MAEIRTDLRYAEIIRVDLGRTEPARPWRNREEMIEKYPDLEIITPNEFQRRYVQTLEPAKKLFESLLTKEEFKSYQLRHVVDFRSSKGNLWRLASRTVSGNCILLADRQSYCAVLDHRNAPMCLVEYNDDELYTQHQMFPPADHWIAQMMMLKTDETSFVHIAHQMTRFTWERMPGESIDEWHAYKKQRDATLPQKRRLDEWF